MNRNRRSLSIATGTSLAGVGLVALAVSRAPRPATAGSSGWAPASDGLAPLFLLALAGGGLLAAGLYLGFDRFAVPRTAIPSKAVRQAGAAAIVGGIGWQPAVRRAILQATTLPGLGSDPWPAVAGWVARASAGLATLLLVVGVIGLYAWSGVERRRWGRRGAGLLVTGLLVGLVGLGLDWALWAGPAVRTGARYGPPGVLHGLGTMLVVAGSVALGAALWSAGVARWIGALVAGAGLADGLLAILLVAAPDAVPGTAVPETLGPFGLAWVLVGAYLILNPVGRLRPHIE